MTSLSNNLEQSAQEPAVNTDTAGLAPLLVYERIPEHLPHVFRDPEKLTARLDALTGIIFLTRNDPFFKSTQ